MMFFKIIFPNRCRERILLKRPLEYFKESLQFINLSIDFIEILIYTKIKRFTSIRHLNLEKFQAK